MEQSHVNVEWFFGGEGAAGWELDVLGMKSKGRYEKKIAVALRQIFFFLL